MLFNSYARFLDQFAHEGDFFLDVGCERFRRAAHRMSARSGEAFKKKMYDDFCAGVKDNLDMAEREADKRAGTKAAEKYAKLADSAWELGHSAGCSWAA